LNIVLRMRWRAAFVLLLGVSAVANAEDEPTVTPYRPTVSNPADLPVPGWLELETGGLRVDGADDSRTDTAPWLLKYAFDENSGVLLGGNAFARQVVAGGRSVSGVGDTFLEFKQRFPVRAGMAFGVEAGVQAPTAADRLGIGKPAYLVNGIYSVDFAAAHMDINVGGTRYSTLASGASHWQSAWALAVSHAFGASIGGAVEVSGTAQHGVSHSHQGLLAVNYNLSPRVVLDTGVTLGLGHAAHDRGLFAGGTFLLGKVH
jgi:hypothetical protein